MTGLSVLAVEWVTVPALVGAAVAALAVVTAPRTRPVRCRCRCGKNDFRNDTDQAVAVGNAGHQDGDP